MENKILQRKMKDDKEKLLQPENIYDRNGDRNNKRQTRNYIFNGQNTYKKFNSPKEKNIKPVSTSGRSPTRRRSVSKICLLPDIPELPNFEALIQEYETGFKSSIESSAKTLIFPVRSNFVKNMIEVFELKYKNAMRSNNRQANTKKTSANDAQRKQPKGGCGSNVNKIIKTLEKMQETTEDSRPVGIELNDEEIEEIRRNLTKCIKINNIPTDVQETSNVFTFPKLSIHGTHDAKNGCVIFKPSPADNFIQETILNKGQKFFCKIKKLRESEVVQRRSRLRCRRDDLWYLKRRGHVFFKNPISDEYLLKCELKKMMKKMRIRNHASHSRNPVNAAKDSLQIYDDVGAILNTLDESENSYKNLQIDVFDFMNEEKRTQRETEAESIWDQAEFNDGLEDIESNCFSLRSNNVSAKLNTTVSDETVVTFLDDEDEIDEAQSTRNVEPIPGTSSSKAPARANSKRPIETEESKWRLLRKKLRYLAMYILFSTYLCFNQDDNDVIERKRENDRQPQRSQQSRHMRTPDSGFPEQNESSSSFASSSSSVRNKTTPNCEASSQENNHDINKQSHVATKEKASCDELAVAGTSYQHTHSRQNKSHREHPKHDDRKVEELCKDGATATCSSRPKFEVPATHFEPCHPSKAIENCSFAPREKDNIDEIELDGGELVKSWYTDLSNRIRDKKDLRRPHLNLMMRTNDMLNTNP